MSALVLLVLVPQCCSMVEPLGCTGKDTSIITAILLGQAYPEIRVSSSSLTLMPCALLGGGFLFSSGVSRCLFGSRGSPDGTRGRVKEISRGARTGPWGREMAKYKVKVHLSCVR